MNEFTYQEKIQRFKNLAKQYYKMQKEILRLKSQIEEINERLVDYRSPSWEKIGSTPTRHELDIVGLIQKKLELEQQLENLEAKCEWIRKCINSIDSPYNRSIANMIYLDGYSINDVSEEYQITPQHVFETTKKSLGESLTDELLLELLLLESDKSAH